MDKASGANRRTKIRWTLLSNRDVDLSKIFKAEALKVGLN